MKLYMENIAIIPARGGSKGIPKKNIVDFLGQPLITYTIEQALGSKRIDEVYVSTDADDIAQISKKAGAKIINRPENIAGDEATTESALIHALNELERKNKKPDLVVLLQCTSPLRREKDIDETVKLVIEEEYDSALTVCEDHSFYWKEMDESAKPINYDPRERKRRQDLDKRYRENGSIYVFKADILEEKECRLGGNIGLYEMPELYSFEIDVPEDLKITEAIGRELDFSS